MGMLSYEIATETTVTTDPVNVMDMRRIMLYHKKQLENFTSDRTPDIRAIRAMNRVSELVGEMSNACMHPLRGSVNSDPR